MMAFHLITINSRDLFHLSYFSGEFFKWIISYDFFSVLISKCHGDLFWSLSVRMTVSILLGNGWTPATHDVIIWTNNNEVHTKWWPISVRDGHLTHRGWVTHIYPGKQDYQWFRQWLVACSAPTHHLKHTKSGLLSIGSLRTFCFCKIWIKTKQCSIKIIFKKPNPNGSLNVLKGPVLQRFSWGAEGPIERGV